MAKKASKDKEWPVDGRPTKENKSHGGVTDEAKKAEGRNEARTKYQTGSKK